MSSPTNLAVAASFSAFMHVLYSTHVECRECNGVNYPTQRRSVELGTMQGQRSAEEPEDEEASEEQPLTSSMPI